MSYRADIEALAGLIDLMRRFDGRAHELADQLCGEQRALAGQWDGAAADRAAGAHRRWLAGHEQVETAFGSLAGFVRAAHANYRCAVEANTRMWR
ncbi:MAG TPA: WXG100 family type VII secretion target [Jatrophihabitans sp.]|jgi:WXG100 family type VII secretion target